MFFTANKSRRAAAAVAGSLACMVGLCGLPAVQRTIATTHRGQVNALKRIAADQTPRSNQSAGVESGGGYGSTPIVFTANRGQASRDVKFTAQGHGYQLALTESEAVVVGVPDQRSGIASHAPVRMKLVNSNKHARLEGIEKLEGVSNYLFGNDPAKWQLNVPTYAMVRYTGVYPGVDLVYYGNEGKLEYDFVVSPGADPAPFRCR